MAFVFPTTLGLPDYIINRLTLRLPTLTPEDIRTGSVDQEKIAVFAPRQNSEFQAVCWWPFGMPKVWRQLERPQLLQDDAWMPIRAGRKFGAIPFADEHNSEISYLYFRALAEDGIMDPETGVKSPMYNTFISPVIKMERGHIDQGGNFVVDRIIWQEPQQ